MPNNPRVNDEAAYKVAKIIKKYGFVVPIIATEDNVIRAGHTRLKAAKILKMERVPVIYVRFDSEAEAIAFAVAENKSHEWADWDKEKLLKILNEIPVVSDDLEKLTGFDLEELKKIEKELEIPDFGGADILDDMDWEKNRLYSITFRFDIKHKPQIRKFLSKYGKKELERKIIEITSD